MCNDKGIFAMKKPLAEWQAFSLTTSSTEVLYRRIVTVLCTTENRITLQRSYVNRNTGFIYFVERFIPSVGWPSPYYVIKELITRNNIESFLYCLPTFSCYLQEFQVKYVLFINYLPHYYNIWFALHIIYLPKILILRSYSTKQLDIFHNNHLSHWPWTAGMNVRDN